MLSSSQPRLMGDARTVSHFLFRDEVIKSTFSEGELIFLGDVLPFLATVGATEGDPASVRLNVPVYLDDPDANDEWWRLMGQDLDAGRKADRVAYEAMIAAQESELSVEDANAVMRVLNEARLALGARLGLDVEDDHDRLPEASRQTLDYLGWIQEELTMELTKTL